MTTRITGIALAMALAGAATACNGDENSPTGPSAVPTGATSAQAATSTAARNGPTPTPLTSAIVQSGGEAGDWTDPGLPQRNHNNAGSEVAPLCATNPSVVPNSSYTYGVVIPNDGKLIVGQVDLEWDWNASLCSGGARYRTVFVVTWDEPRDGASPYETDTVAGYGSYQPTTYFVPATGPTHPSKGSYIVEVGTQIWHHDHWSEPTMDTATRFVFTM